VFALRKAEWMKHVWGGRVCLPLRKAEWMKLFAAGECVCAGIRVAAENKGSAPLPSHVCSKFA